MTRNKRTLPLGAALLGLLLSAAQAQTTTPVLPITPDSAGIRTSLPLTSVGDKLLWSVGDQTLTLTVRRAGPVKLDLYSPQLDPADYRADTYYGDETYDKKGVSTAFELVNADGQTVATRTYQPGAQTWDTLFDLPLAAGTYSLRASTSGNGKNTFALRLSAASASVSADHLAVNVHSRAFVPVLDITTDGPGYALDLYDGDGAGELEAQLRADDGTLTPLQVSAQRGTVRLSLPDMAGHYTVELRQPDTAKQYSNTVGFTLIRSGAPASVTLTSVDTLGLLNTEARLLLPTGPVPVSVPVTIGDETITALPSTERRPAGTYPVRVAPMAGAEIGAPETVTVKAGTTSTVRVEVTPKVDLSLENQSGVVCVGDPVRLLAEATTGYAGDLQGTLSLEAPGLEVQDDGMPDSGTFNAAQALQEAQTFIADQPGMFTVTAKLAPWGLSKTLSVTVASAGEANCPVATVVTPVVETPVVVTPPVVETPVVVAPPAPLPTAARTSTVTLPFSSGQTASSSTSLTVVHRIPAGASYVVGSSKLDGRAIPDPRVLPSGEVAWTLSGVANGTVSYDLDHQDVLPALADPALILSEGTTLQTLQGKVSAADMDKINTGPKVSTEQAEPTSAPRTNPGALALPLDGSVFRDRDRIGLTVVTPKGDTRVPSVNGVALTSDLVSSRSEDENGTVTTSYLGVPITTGRNVLSLGSETVTVTLAGPTTRLEFTPVSLLADGRTPVRLRVTAFDAAGVPSGSRFLHIETSPEPLTPDADPGDSGYQIALKDGVGEIVLTPQALPGNITVRALVDSQYVRQSYDLTPSGQSLGVAVGSVTVSFPGENGSGIGAPVVTAQGRASYQGPLGGGALSLAADSAGLSVPVDPLLRYPGYGDASQEGTALTGLDPVALSYDRPGFRVQYRQGPLPVTVFDLGTNLTALSGTLGDPDGFSVSGYVAAVPGDLKSETLTPDGTRLLRLAQGDLIPNSESVTLIHSRLGLEVKRETLVQNVDYTLDPVSGVITLIRGLSPTDGTLDDLQVLVSYRLLDANAGRRIAGGGQVQAVLGNLTLAAAVVSQDGVFTSGVRARYDDGLARGSLRVAYANGLQVLGDFTVRAPNTVAVATLSSQDGSYNGLNGTSSGTVFRAHLEQKLSVNLSAVLDGEYHNLPQGVSTDTDLSGTPFYSSPLTDANVTDTRGGSVSGLGKFQYGTFSVGAGARYAFGDVNGLAVIGSAGYHDAGVDVDLTHAQPVSGNLLPVTVLQGRVRIGRAGGQGAVFGVQDQYTWGGDNLATVSLGTDFSGVGLANTNYAVSYQLPTASGAGNRARFGADTSLPLGGGFTAGLRGAALRDFSAGLNTYSAGADLRYAGTGLQASLGADLAMDTVFHTVLHGGLSGQVTDRLSLSADGTLDLTQDAPGGRAGLGYAYRSGQFNSLGYARYRSGSLAGATPEFTAGLSAEAHAESYRVQGGVDTRLLLNDAGSFTWQPALGGTFYLGDRFGVGAWGRALIQPGNTVYGYGLELSARALPGTWISAGYNFAGFDGLTSGTGVPTRAGLYLRLDLTLDTGDTK